MRHAGVGGRPSAFELLGQHRYLRAQAASNIWLGSLYVSIAGNLDPPSRLRPFRLHLRSRHECAVSYLSSLILRKFGKICKATPCKVGQSRPPSLLLGESQLNQPPQRLRSRWRVGLLVGPRFDFVLQRGRKPHWDRFAVPTPGRPPPFSVYTFFLLLHDFSCTLKCRPATRQPPRHRP